MRDERLERGVKLNRNAEGMKVGETIRGGVETLYDQDESLRRRILFFSLQ